MLDAEREPALVYNANPRCFLAVELEKETDEKHVLGGIVHASGLAKVGIIVTDDDLKKYQSIMRIRRYLRFLIAVGKTGNPSHVTLGKNTIVLPRAQFLEALHNYRPLHEKSTTRVSEDDNGPAMMMQESDFEGETISGMTPPPVFCRIHGLPTYVQKRSALVQRLAGFRLFDHFTNSGKWFSA